MTPRPTRVVLVSTIVVTIGAVALFLAAVARDGLAPRATGCFLLLFTGLFCLRVAGQVLVARRAPAWLPPMGQWNLVPYRFLLPVQLLIVCLMVWLLFDFLGGSGVATEPAPRLGLFLIGFSLVYAVAMAIRYAVRMRRRPAERWLGGTIPIVYHWVLAAFLLVLGTYHVAR